MSRSQSLAHSVSSRSRFSNQWQGGPCDGEAGGRSTSGTGISIEALGLLVEAAPDAVLVTDREGHIVVANRQTEALFGYARDELVGQRVEMLVPEEAWSRHVEHRARYYAEPHARQMGSDLNLSARRRDGTLFPVEISLSFIEGDDGILVTSALRDVTERQRLAAHVAQTQKMESLGRMAGGVAHNLNNLMTAIIGNTDLALMSLATTPSASASLAEDMRAVRKSAQSAAALAGHLLAFSRHQVNQPEVLNPRALIMEIGDMMGRIIGEHISLTVTTAPGLWCVLVDPNQLEQALINLIMNARDAMPSGGALSIEATNVTVDEHDHDRRPIVGAGDYVMITVSDTGIGMPAEVQQHLFEPFFTTKGVGQGTGLGLATSYGIVRQANGHISAESAPGQGSTFTILLPRTGEAASTAAHADGIGELPQGNETILLAEDEPGVRRLAARALRELGYTVLEASDGRHAIDMAAAHPGTIDLLLADVIMPKMSGTEIAQQLRALLPELRVLFMSGYTGDMLIRQGVVASDPALLPKPFTLSLLAEHVRRCLDA